MSLENSIEATREALRSAQARRQRIIEAGNVLAAMSALTTERKLRVHLAKLLERSERES